MKKSIILLGIAGLIIGFNCACSQKQLDRADLIEIMDQYLVALVKHDPAEVPLAEDVKLVENIKATAIGEGLWKTATGGPTDFKIYVADPVAESIGFMGVIENDGDPVLLGARLQLENGEIAEIDCSSKILGEIEQFILSFADYHTGLRRSLKSFKFLSQLK